MRRRLSLAQQPKIFYLFIFLLFNIITQAQQLDGAKVFTNPIADGADPWVVKESGFYYMCMSGADTKSITVAKSASPTQFKKPVKVWTAPHGKWNSTNVWAPELHRIGEKWYIYYAAGKSGPPYIHQRSGVLESVTDDPQGAYIEKSVLRTGYDPTDLLKTIWAIDVTVGTINGQLYAVWSGWEKNAATDKTSQHLYMAKMSNPWTIEGERVKISSPEQAWETGGSLNLNEGPQFLKKNGNVFIVYSARESWLTTYRLGLLRLNDINKTPLNSSNWTKKGPVFMGTDKVFGVGHAGFTTSPDDSEDWIFYHSKKETKPGWSRNIRLQKFTWGTNGEPLFGKPIPEGVPIKKPSGDALAMANGRYQDFTALKKNFDTLIDNKPVGLYILKNNKNAQVAITNYGCRIVGLLVPNKQGELTDVVLGFKSIAEYVKPEAVFFGPIVGRFANRIKNGQFALEGKTYQVPPNNGPNALHGGPNGLFAKVWQANQPNENTLILKYTSPDGEEGFPGNLNITLTYTFNNKNELQMEYEATTDKTTVVNLSNHAFFNLNGESSGTIEKHLLKINAEKYTPVDGNLIPVGTHTAVKQTPFDFRVPFEIGARIKQNDQQLIFGKGYDHNFVLRPGREGKLNYAGTLLGDISGIKMDIYTTEPGLQFYSGNFFDGGNILKSGARDIHRLAVALETQHFPDSPNHPSFPSTVLKPKEKYHSISVYQFSVK